MLQLLPNHIISCQGYKRLFSQLMDLALKTGTKQYTFHYQGVKFSTDATLCHFNSLHSLMQGYSYQLGEKMIASVSNT